MSYSRTFDALIPPITYPDDISQQRFEILADYGYRMDELTVTIYQLLFAQFRETAYYRCTQDQEILNKIYEHHQWLPQRLSDIYTAKVNSGTDVRRIKYDVIVKIVNDLLVQLYKKYGHNAWECIYSFLNIAYSELGTNQVPVVIDLVGIAINPQTWTYELRAQASLL